jgi:hypothetical protein
VLEQPLGERRREFALGGGEVLVEELDVLAQVEDEETRRSASSLQR